MDVELAEFDKEEALSTISSWPEFSVLQQDSDLQQDYVNLMAETILKIFKAAHENKIEYLEYKYYKYTTMRKLIRSIILGGAGMMFVLLLALTGALGNFKWAVLALCLIPFILLTIFPIIRLIRTATNEDEGTNQYYERKITAKTNIANTRGNLQAYMDIREIENAPNDLPTLH